MTRLLPTLTLLLLAPVPVLAFPISVMQTPATAAGPLVPVQEREEREPGPADLEEATEIAIERFGGEVASAATVERDGREVHEIRLFDEGNEGRVRTVRIDPDTGRIIPPRR